MPAHDNLVDARLWCLAVFGTVHDEVLNGCSIGMEAQVVHESISKELCIASGRCQVACGYDEVGVTIIDAYGDACRLYDVEFLLSHDDYILRGSVITPVTALAATVRGDANMVRAPGPCRPTKLRLLVLMLSLPAGTLSGFIARQAEQLGKRNSKPASRSISSMPSSIICWRTFQLPGTSQATTLSAL